MNLTTRYLGLQLRNPLVASAGPFAHSVAGVRRLAEAGVGAVVLPSLFEEQVRLEAERDTWLSEAGSESFPESLTYLPAPDGKAGPRRYLSLVEQASAAVDIPVIASLNGVTTGGWTDYATALQEAGAAAIELNIYYLPSDPLISGRDFEQRHVEVATTVLAAVTIPVSVKLGPYFSSLGELAIRLDRVGVHGLVLFNRFMQTDIDPETLTVSRGLRLSAPFEASLPRSWIARLRGRVRASIAASTGVETPSDVAAYLLAGADVVMTTSSLLRHGPGHATELLDGLTSWLSRKGFSSVDDARGLLAAQAQAEQSAFDRAGYLSAIAEATRAYGPI
jgi:dihydroorotate dehydrogenase (fumarate)